MKNEEMANDQLESADFPKTAQLLTDIQ